VVRFGQVNQQNFGQPGITDYRNPHLAGSDEGELRLMFRDLGWESSWQKELGKNGNPPWNLNSGKTRMLVTRLGKN